MKKILFSIILVFSFFINSFHVYSSTNPVFDNPDNRIRYCSDEKECTFSGGLIIMKTPSGIVNDRPASQYIQDIAIYLLRFLSLTATLIIIYAGFVLLTSLGNEEKVKKSKKIIIYAILGLIIIYGAGPFSDFVFGVLNA